MRPCVKHFEHHLGPETGTTSSRSQSSAQLETKTLHTSSRRGVVGGAWARPAAGHARAWTEKGSTSHVDQSISKRVTESRVPTDHQAPAKQRRQQDRGLRTKKLSGESKASYYRLTPSLGRTYAWRPRSAEDDAQQRPDQLGWHGNGDAAQGNSLSLATRTMMAR